MNESRKLATLEKQHKTATSELAALEEEIAMTTALEEKMTVYKELQERMKVMREEIKAIKEGKFKSPEQPEEIVEDECIEEECGEGEHPPEEEPAFGTPSQTLAESWASATFTEASDSIVSALQEKLAETEDPEEIVNIKDELSQYGVETEDELPVEEPVDLRSEILNLENQLKDQTLSDDEKLEIQSRIDALRNELGQQSEEIAE